MKSLILISSLVLVSGFPDGDHHGDGHEDNCVDVSKYSEVQYNITTAAICTYRTKQTCTKKVSSACISVPVTECEVTGYADCTTTGFTELYPDAKTTSQSFVPKDCFQNGQQTLIEYHKQPVCKPATKQQCDTKWIINEQGEKEWAGNENCIDVTWEDCTLELVPTPVTVPIWKCVDGAKIFYTVPEFYEVEVTRYTSECTASAYPTCTTSSVQKCTEVEYDECFDTIETVCFGAGAGGAGVNGFTFKVPYQTFDHRLKCIGDF